MSHAGLSQPQQPNSEPVRIAAYLAGFALGVLAVVVGITMLILDDTRGDVWWAIIGLGLTLIGQGGLATMFVPSLRNSRHGSEK